MAEKSTMIVAILLTLVAPAVPGLIFYLVSHPGTFVETTIWFVVSFVTYIITYFSIMNWIMGSHSSYDMIIKDE